MDTVVTLHVWRMPTRALPQVLARMATDRARLRRHPGVRFAKLLGTGTGSGLRPARRRRQPLGGPARTRTRPNATGHRALDQLSEAHARLDLAPIASRGTWSGRRPFEATRRRRVPTEWSWP